MDVVLFNFTTIVWRRRPEQVKSACKVSTWRIRRVTSGVFLLTPLAGVVPMASKRPAHALELSKLAPTSCWGPLLHTTLFGVPELFASPAGDGMGLSLFAELGAATGTGSLSAAWASVCTITGGLGTAAAVGTCVGLMAQITTQRYRTVHLTSTKSLTFGQRLRPQKRC